MPLSSFCWPRTSEADAGGITVEAELSHQHPATCCCCETDGSRGASGGTVSDMEAHAKQRYTTEVLHTKKNGTYWHSLTLAECLWRPNSGCEHSEAVGGAFQQWQQWHWITSTDTHFYEQGMQVLVHCWWKCIANGSDYVEKQGFVAENLLYQRVIVVLFVAVVVSKEINKMHYFWSNMWNSKIVFPLHMLCMFIVYSALT